MLIRVIRGEAHEDILRRALRAGRVRMGSIVLQELYAGTRTRADKRDLDEIERAFRSRGYLVTPAHAEWITAGIALARYQRLRGAVDPRKHIPDILIVSSAAKAGADLVTENVTDMQRWSRMVRRRGRPLRIVPLRPPHR